MPGIPRAANMVPNPRRLGPGLDTSDPRRDAGRLMGPSSDEDAQTFRVGQVECRRISDGVVDYPSEELFLDVSRDALRAAGIGASGTLVYSPLLIRTAGPLVLVDAGTGPELAKEWDLPAGHTVDALAAASISPE